MELKYLFAAFAMTVTFSVSALAQAPTGATGQCKDGTYSTAAKKSGACSGHKGVQTWYATSAATAAQPASTPTPKTAAITAAAPVTAPATAAPAPQPAAPVQARTSSAAPQAQAPGGGPGMVWVNKTSKVYHCSGTKYYGTTKNGKYMSEADAKAEGDHPDHGKVCTQQ